MLALSRTGPRRTVIVVGVSLAAFVVIHQLSYIGDLVGADALSKSIEVVGICPYPSNRPDDSRVDTDRRIPNLVHQIWKSSNVSTYSIEASHEPWRSMFEPMNYTVKLWTDEDIIATIKKRYPWLLSTYEGYPQDIQRADIARLLVVHAEGGIYADLDVHPASSETISCLQDLGLQTIFSPTSGSLGLSNHFFMAEKDSAFLSWALHEAKRRERTSRRIILPYLQVFWSTGPLMVTSAYRRYMHTMAHGSARANPSSRELGVLDEEYAGSVVKHRAGRSWHSTDGKVSNYLGDRVGLDSPWLILVFLAAVMVLLGILARLYTRDSRRSIHKPME